MKKEIHIMSMKMELESICLNKLEKMTISLKFKLIKMGKNS